MQPTIDHPSAAGDGSPPAGLWRWLPAMGILAALPTFLAGLAPWWWIGDLFSHFRLQYVCLLLPPCLVFAAQRRWAITTVLGAALAVNLFLVAPLLLSPRPQVRDGSSLRLMSANVFVGNQNSEAVIQLVRQEQPDLFLAIEVSPRWQRDLEVLQEDYPHVLAARRTQSFGGHDAFGIALFSREPATMSEVRRVGIEGLPVLVAEFGVNGSPLTVIGVHPYPPVSRACTAIRNEYLAAAADIAAAIDGACILLGDLNTTSWSPSFLELLRRSGLRDSRPGFGIQPTWPDGPWLLRIPIDHALVSRELTIADHRIGPSTDSDHRPVIIEIQVDPVGTGAELPE